ncbi:hypothetical protein CARUB_v10002978mg [Capsella rubella]|uniref:RING-type domain-containing protein n=1 Tax=Capsella rubella TaxID=81985 RepID=R0FIX6_9BRAS|nr:pre-mRNA-splicing factor CWC24 [Capsella rubella]EOA22357.1 hypothetical protein CARUB_v10002978mg [Capsella rubella]
MSDSSEPKTSAVQESRLAEQETNSPQGDVTKNLKKRSLDAGEVEGSRLENLKKKDKKQTSRNLEADFEPTEEEDDPLPLDCSICKRPFLDPVVTNCNHYFCEKCALKHHTENNNCFVCNEPTFGDFITAVEIKERIEEEREKARAMVKEVSAMVERASVMNDDAKGASERALKMVAEVETMLEKVAAMATKAGETAAMAAEMVQEADATMETAKANMIKAFAVIKTVVWNK